MATPITQRELRNESGRIMRELDEGKSFVLTRNGVPVGELKPLRKRQFVPTRELVEAFRELGSIDAERFYADIDDGIDQGIAPRG